MDTNKKNYVVSGLISIKDAIAKLNLFKTGFLIVCDKEKMIGLLTDGDLRRGVLNGKTVNDRVENLMNTDFRYVNEEFHLPEVLSLFEDGFKVIPVLGTANKYITVLTPENVKVNKIDFETVRSKAPTRLSFSGGGSDVPYFFNEYGDGIVIGAAINKFANCTIKRRNDLSIKINSVDLNITKIYPDLNALSLADDELGLIRSVILEFKPNFGLDVTLDCDYPVGSGLGGSSAAAVALVSCLSKHCGIKLTKYQISEISFKIERVNLGSNGGWQDQLTSVFGGLNVMNFSKKDVEVNKIPVSQEFIWELSSRLVLCIIGGRRNSSIEHQVKKTQLSNYERNIKQAVSVSKKLQSALKREELSLCLDIIKESWEAKSKPVGELELDFKKMDNIARSLGCETMKLMGAGSSGFVVFLVDPEKRANFINKMTESGFKAEKIELSMEGISTWSF